MHTYTKIETPLGDVWLVATSADHVCVTTSGEGSNDKTEIVVHRVSYRGSVHLHLWKNGKWNIGDENKLPEWQREREAVYLDRADRFDNRNASEAARKRALPCLLECARHYLAAHPEILHVAETERIESEIESAERDEAELETKLYDVRKKLVSLRTRQFALDNIGRDMARNDSDGERIECEAVAVTVTDADTQRLVERLLL